MSKVIVGREYRHYKDPQNSVYRVVAIGHLEAAPRAEMVVYKHCKLGNVWIRPRDDFESSVVINNGFLVDRFEVIR